MRRLTAVVGLLTLGCTFATQAQDQRPPPRFFDHAILVRVHSTPSGAMLHSAPKGTNGVPQEVGRTPKTLTVGLSWDERFGRKDWKKLNVWSAGDAVRCEFTPEKNYDIYVSLAAEKAGYVRQEAEQKVATLTPPGFGWDGMKDWPSNARMQFDLEPESAPENVSMPKAKKKKVPTKIVASQASADLSQLGTIELRCNVERAPIYVDRQFAGRTPLNLMLTEGEHIIEVREIGYRAVRKRVNIRGEARYALEVTLTPVYEEP